MNIETQCMGNLCGMLLMKAAMVPGDLSGENDLEVGKFR